MRSFGRVASVLISVLIAVLMAFVGLNFGAATGPDDDVRVGGAPSAEPGATGQAEAPKSRVERMMAGLASGRSVKSFDNPAAGADIPAIKAASDVPVGRLRISEMELRTPFLEGVHDSVINKGPGHWPGTPLPGQPGNSVISGHRATHGAEFVDLDDLRPGDDIDVWVGGTEAPLTYQVQGTTIVPQSRYVEYVLRQPTDPGTRMITLFACDPVWDHTHRIVVRAEASPTGATQGG